MKKNGFTLVELVISIVLISIVGTMVIAGGIGFWMLKKKVNYSLQYEQMVKKTVREMVKTEALK